MVGTPAGAWHDPAGQPPLDRKPTAEDFTPRAVQRAVLQDTLQHPATILPAALATVAALWSVAIDLSPASLMAMLGFGFVSAAAWVINYVGRGDTLVEQHIQKLRALRAEYERREVEELALACRRRRLYSPGRKKLRNSPRPTTSCTSFSSSSEPARGTPVVSGFASWRRRPTATASRFSGEPSTSSRRCNSVDVDTLEQERQAWIRQREQEGTVRKP